jgi:hypothetical protein
MLKWVRDESIKLGFVFVSTKSDCNSNRIKLILVLGCEEEGYYIERIAAQKHIHII